ncbi:hypothetical protein GA0115260_109917 [Streptomyces sp. MnatMP-M27]|nr:hypothetical protein GA0115260_109917 [Streptomyces sp. MnatMP-M27]
MASPMALAPARTRSVAASAEGCDWTSSRISPGPGSPRVPAYTVCPALRSAWAVSLPKPLDAPVITMIVRWLPRWPG